MLSFAFGLKLGLESFNLRQLLELKLLSFGIACTFAYGFGLLC